MGLFDDEAKKMAEESAAQARAGAQEQAEQNQVARRISDELLSYIGNHPSNEDIEVGVDQNKITVRRKSPGRTLEITSQHRNTFSLKETAGFQKQVAVQPRKTIPSGTTNGSGMARAVIEWLNEQ